MKTYLKAFDIWDVIEDGHELEPLRQNLTVTQTKQYNEDAAKGFEALSVIHSSVSDFIFTRIMACSMEKEAWDTFQKEFEGSKRTRKMQILNLKIEFETLKKKENESVGDFINRLLRLVNQTRVLGEELKDQRIVEKVLISLSEKFNAL